MMSYYPIALFLHIAGALGFFMALGLEWTSVRQLRRATTTAQVRLWLRISAGTSRVGMPSMLLLLISGALMMTNWGGAAWILVSIGAIVLMVILTLAISRPRVAAIERAVAVMDAASASDEGNEKNEYKENANLNEESLSPMVRQQMQHPLLWLGIKSRVAVALGIVFLMSVKPDLNGSLLIIGIATLIGLAASLPMPGRARVQEEAVA